MNEANLEGLQRLFDRSSANGFLVGMRIWRTLNEGLVVIDWEWFFFFMAYIKEMKRF